MTGTLINVAAVLAGTAIGVAVGGRLPPGLQQRVLAGLGLVAAVVGVDLAAMAQAAPHAPQWLAPTRRGPAHFAQSATTSRPQPSQ